MYEILVTDMNHDVQFTSCGFRLLDVSQAFDFLTGCWKALVPWPSLGIFV